MARLRTFWETVPRERRMTRQPLPGRVVVHEVDRRSSIIHMVDGNPRDQTSHRGIVVAMGPPARTPRGDAPVPHGFSVGAEVVFVYGEGPVESGRQGMWGDRKVLWISQEEILAVITCPRCPETCECP